jgi:hypothetical protein
MGHSNFWWPEDDNLLSYRTPEFLLLVTSGPANQPSKVSRQVATQTSDSSD